MRPFTRAVDHRSLFGDLAADDEHRVLRVMQHAGGHTPEEGALSRFGGGRFSLETKIDTATRKRTMATTLAAMEAEADNDLNRAQDPAPTPGLVAEAEAQTTQQTPEPIPPITNQS